MVGYSDLFAECASWSHDLAVASLPLYRRKSEVCALDEVIAFDDLWTRVDPAVGPCARPRHP